MITVKKQWFIGLGIAMLISLNCLVTHGMEPLYPAGRPKEKQSTGIFNYIRSSPMELQDKILEDANVYLRLLPEELQQHILSFSDAIVFLSQQPIATLVGHTGVVRAVAVVGDPTLLKLGRAGKVVTESDDHTAKIWDLNTGALLNTLVGHTGGVWAVAVAGDKVVTGSADKTAKIWSLKPLAGTPQDNPLLWIIYNATVPQLNFIDRAYQATIAQPEQDLIIALPAQLGKIQNTDTQEQVDGNIYFSFPEQVRKYLRDNLNIRRR